MPADREDRKSAQLLRGSACLCCRKRKIRCNGERPFCGPCVQHERLDECIYDDTKKKSRTQLLREKVAHLERKLAELEATSDVVTAAASLVQNQCTAPSSPANSSSSYASSPAIALIDGSGSSSRDSGALGTTAMGEGSSSLRLTPAAGDKRTRDRVIGEALDAILAQFRQRTPETKLELSSETQRYLLNVFINHRSQCYFYSDLTRFQFSHLQLPGDQPHPALIHAINLLGCYFSRNPQFRIYEMDLVKLSSHEILVSLQDTEHFLDLIQASSLLALYLFFNGRFVEGYRHAFAASRLAVGMNLHQIKYPDEKYFENYVEYWDRVVLFWQVYLVDRSWSSVVHGVISAFSLDEYRNEITTPMMWGSDPLQLADPFMVPSYLTRLMDYTLIDPTLDTMVMSTPALQAFVTTLYDRAFHSLTDEQTAKSKPGVLMGIQRLQNILPSFLGREMWRNQAPYVDAELMVVHTMLRVLELKVCLDEEMEMLARVHTQRAVTGTSDISIVSSGVDVVDIGIGLGLGAGGTGGSGCGGSEDLGLENETNMKVLWIVDWLTRSLEQVNEDDYPFMDLVFPGVWSKAAELLIQKARQLRTLMPSSSISIPTSIPISIPTEVAGPSNPYSINPDIQTANVTDNVHVGGQLNQNQISSTIMFVDNCVDSLYRAMRGFNSVTQIAGDYVEKLEQEYIPLGYTVPVPLNTMDTNIVFRLS